MRKRNARISTHGKCSRQPRYDPIGNPLGLEPLDLLGCPCKDRRVPTLETNHTLTVPSRLDDQIIDLRLRPCPPIASLTHTNSLAARRSKLQDLLIDQPIVKDHLGLLDRTLSPKRQQIRIPRTGAHQVHSFTHRIKPILCRSDAL